MRKQLNKKERIGILVSASVVLVFVFVFCAKPKKKDASPVLELKGYEFHGTNAVAKLEFKNTTDTTLWLFLSGTSEPLGPAFFTRPLVVEHPLVAPPLATNVYSLNVAEPLFLQGQAVRPSETLDLEYQITAQEPDERVGVHYYTGNYADGNEFMDNCTLLCSEERGGLKEHLKYALTNLKRRFKAPDPHQVWCAQTLTCQQKPPSQSPDRVK